MSNEDKAQVFTGPMGISYFQFCSAKAAISLEAKGLGHSSGKSMRKAWAKQLGMKQNASHEMVIMELERRIKGILLWQKDPNSYKGIATAFGFALAEGSDGSFKYAKEEDGKWTYSISTFKTQDEMWKACCEEQELVEASKQLGNPPPTTDGQRVNPDPNPQEGA